MGQCELGAAGRLISGGGRHRELAGSNASSPDPHGWRCPRSGPHRQSLAARQALALGQGGTFPRAPCVAPAGRRRALDGASATVSPTPRAQLQWVRAGRAPGGQSRVCAASATPSPASLTPLPSRAFLWAQGPTSGGEPLPSSRASLISRAGRRAPGAPATQQPEMVVTRQRL